MQSGSLVADRAAVRPCRQQVPGVDLLRLVLGEVGEAPVVRVGLEERVVGRSQSGVLVPAAQLLLVEHRRFEAVDEVGHGEPGQPVLAAAHALPAGVLQNAERALHAGAEVEGASQAAGADVLAMHELALVVSVRRVGREVHSLVGAAGPRLPALGRGDDGQPGLAGDGHVIGDAGRRTHV